MTRYADPRRCPDCFGPITYGLAACPRCGLTLQGTTAQHLFETLTTADELLESLRSESRVLETVPQQAPTSAAVPGPFPAPTPAVTPAVPATPAAPAAPTRGMTSASVPKVLLTLGAGCVLVAALVFLAVTWSVMGVAGRTATLLAFTAIGGGLTAWVAHRGLRAATESLGLVALGLLTLDVIGARHAGWLGPISDSGFLIVLGLVLAAAGAAASVAVRRTPVTGLVSAEVVTVIALATTAVGIMSGPWFTQSVALLLAVLAMTLATYALRLLRLEIATVGAAIVTTGSWLGLTGYALVRAVTHDTLSGLWSHFDGWPLLAAAALVAAGALLRVPTPVRVGCVSTGTLLLAVLAVLPADDTQTTATLGVLVVLALVGTVGVVASRPWGLVVVLPFVAGGLWLVAVGGQVGARALASLADTAARAWDGTPGGRFAHHPVPGAPAPWLLPVVVLALGALAWVVGRATRAAPVAPVSVPQSVLRATAGLPISVAVAGATVVATLVCYPVPVWIALVALLASATGFVLWWARQHSVAPLAAAACYLSVGVVVSAYDEWLTAASLLVALALTGLVHLRTVNRDLAAAAGVLVALCLAGSAWTWGGVVEADRDWTAVAGMLLLALVTLVAPALPDRWWSASPATTARTGIECGAAGAAVPLALVGILSVPSPHQATWTAVYLTIAGATLAAIALVRTDRRELGWLGGALLAMASWVRLADIGVHAPEAYTLPSATALLVVGVVALRRRHDVGSLPALSAGLALGLVPSLLWVLDQPATWRALLLGVACLVLLGAGLRLRWSAPVVYAAGVGALVVLRQAAPFVDAAVPRWILIGLAGAVLIGVGITWERRVAEVRALLGFVRRLR